jgi:hypothetical protein
VCPNFKKNFFFRTTSDEQLCVASTSKTINFAPTAPTDTEPVSVEEKVNVDTEEEEKLAILNEFFISDESEDDHTTSEPAAASPKSTSIKSLQVDQPTTSAQLCQHSSPNETQHLPTDTGPVLVEENANIMVEKLAAVYNVLNDHQVGIPTTTTTNATNTQDIKIHIHLEPTTRIKIMQSKKLSDLIPYIEEHLKQRVLESDIVKVNTFSMKRNVEKYLRKAMQHCGDLPDFEDKISITIRMSTPAASLTAGIQKNAESLHLKDDMKKVIY